MQIFRRRTDPGTSAGSPAPKPVSRLARVAHLILGGVLVLFSLAPLGFAFGFFLLGVRRWFGDPFYLVPHAWNSGLFWLILGLFMLLPAGYYAWRPRARVGWFGLSFLALLLTAETIPNQVLPYMFISEAQSNLNAQAHSLATLLETLQQGKLPSSQAGLMRWVTQAERPNGVISREGLLGPYFHDGKRVRVRLEYLGGANGPLLAMPAHPPLPAAIYCAVSQDRERFWLTVTMLDRRVGGHPRWLEASGGSERPMVISGAVAAVAPATAKGEN